jgi:3-oxoacyl-[acyl-carrier protein] reductase
MASKRSIVRYFRTIFPIYVRLSGIRKDAWSSRQQAAEDDMTGQTSKVAIITGGSRGIGAAIAERFARDGFTVVINYAGNDAAAEALVRKIERAGSRALAAKGDVADPSTMRKLFEAAEAAFGGVDVLVNNAGILTLGKLADVEDAAFDRQIAINLKGTFNGLREAARRLRDGGRIISVSTSVVGLRLETYGVYAATKAAVETMTGILAKELRGRSITVNAIAPGPTATELFFEGKSSEVIERMARMSPLERLGTPQDIAGIASFLAGSDGGWVNGQVLRANGGLV